MLLSPNHGSRLIWLDADSGLYGPAALAFRQGKDQIQIELDNVRHIFDETGNPQ